MLLQIGLGPAGGKYPPAYALAHAEYNQRNPEEEKACPEENQAFSYNELRDDKAQEPLNNIPAHGITKNAYNELRDDKAQEPLNNIPAHGITKNEPEAEKKPADAGTGLNQPEHKIIPLVVRSVPNTHNMVALTFDDGPFPRWTKQYLQVLALHGIPATFFVTGQRAQRYPEGIQIIQTAGHEIANHSFSHQRLTCLQEKDIVRELMLANQVLEQISGKKPVLFRPPYGSFNQQVTELAWAQGLRTVTWSVDPQDWKGPGAEALAKKVVSRTKAGDIILLHEGKLETLAALSTIISGIQEKGLVFVSVSTLLGKTGSLAN